MIMTSLRYLSLSSSSTSIQYCRNAVHRSVSVWVTTVWPSNCRFPDCSDRCKMLAVTLFGVKRVLLQSQIQNGFVRSTVVANRPSGTIDYSGTRLAQTSLANPTCPSPAPSIHVDTNGLGACVKCSLSLFLLLPSPQATSIDESEFSPTTATTTDTSSPLTFTNIRLVLKVNCCTRLVPINFNYADITIPNLHRP